MYEDLTERNIPLGRLAEVRTLYRVGTAGKVHAADCRTDATPLVARLTDFDERDLCRRCQPGHEHKEYLAAARELVSWDADVREILATGTLAGRGFLGPTPLAVATQTTSRLGLAELGMASDDPGLADWARVHLTPLLRQARAELAALDDVAPILSGDWCRRLRALSALGPLGDPRTTDLAFDLPNTPALGATLTRDAPGGIRPGETGSGPVLSAMLEEFRAEWLRTGDLDTAREATTEAGLAALADYRTPTLPQIPDTDDVDAAVAAMRSDLGMSAGEPVGLRDLMLHQWRAAAQADVAVLADAMAAAVAGRDAAGEGRPVVVGFAASLLVNRQLTHSERSGEVIRRHVLHVDVAAAVSASRGQLMAVLGEHTLEALYRLKLLRRDETSVSWGPAQPGDDGATLATACQLLAQTQVSRGEALDLARAVAV